MAKTSFRYRSNYFGEGSRSIHNQSIGSGVGYESYAIDEIACAKQQASVEACGFRVMNGAR